MSGSEPEPLPPTVKGLMTMSFQVFTGEVCQVTNTLASLVPLPNQVNFVESNCTLVRRSAAPSPCRGEDADGRAILRRDVVEIVGHLQVPAPGMFCTTIAGLPGMCLPRCRARMRE